MDGITYERGKFIPAGTPVLIRAKDIPAENAVSGYAGDYDRDHANTTARYITLSLPTSAPATITTEDKNFFIGQYLEQELPSTDLDEGEHIYVFGQSTDSDYTTKTQEDEPGTPDEAGFYQNKNTVDGSATYSQADSLYVRHNKIYIIDKYDGSKYVKHTDSSPAPAFIPLWFGETGVDDEMRQDAGMIYPDGVYDLNGRQVLTPEMMQEDGWRKRLTKGVYIINGRKMVVK